MSDTLVNDTDKVTLDCQADGYPSPTIGWIFVSNNSFVPGTFRITGKQEEGFYRCIASEIHLQETSSLLFFVSQTQISQL